MSLSNNVTPSHGRVEKAFDAAGYIPIVGTVTGAVRLVAATVSLVAFAVLSGLGALGFTSEEAKTRHFALLTQRKDQIKMGLTELIPGLKNLCYYYNKNSETGANPAQQNPSAEGLSVTATEQTTRMNTTNTENTLANSPEETSGQHDDKVDSEINKPGAASKSETVDENIPAELPSQQNSLAEHLLGNNAPEQSGMNAINSEETSDQSVKDDSESNKSEDSALGASSNPETGSDEHSSAEVNQNDERHDFLDKNTGLAGLDIVPYRGTDEFVQGINEKETLKNIVDQLAFCYPLNQPISGIKQQQVAAAPSNGTSGWMHNKMKPALVTLMFMASAGIYLFSTNLRMNGAAPASSPICV